MAELWDLYDENRNPLNQTHVRGVPLPEGAYHLVVEIWTVNHRGEILVTQRHPEKPYGLLWECTGGAVVAGEDSRTGALRELFEEVGIKAAPEELNRIESERFPRGFVDTFVIRKTVERKDLTLQPEEVVDARFVTGKELKEMWDKKLLVPREHFGHCMKILERYANGSENEKA